MTKLSVNNISGSIFVFSADNHKIYKSTNEGDLWYTVLRINGNIVVLISKKGNLYAISDSGDFYISADDGDTWDSSFVSKGLTCIDVCSTGQIFIGTNKIEIYSSVDAGKTWNSLIIDIANDIAIDNNDNILACTYDGFSVSKDLGQSWDWLIAPGRTVPLNYSTKSNVSIDNNNNWYLNEAYILKSTNNGATWTSLGGEYLNMKVKVFGDNLYLASANGLFKYDPSYPIYVGNNYFPLKVGNKWQFIYDNYSYSIGPTYHLIQQIEVINDTLIKGHKYFKIKSIDGNTYFDYDNRWIRYSEDDKKIYTWSSDSDAVYMDFNLSVNSTFFHVSNFLNTTNQNMITEGSKNFFNNSFKYKGYLTGWGAMEEHEQEFGENIGPISFSDFGHPIGPGKHNASSTLINAIIYDSTNTPIYYSNHNKPEINLSPANKINTDTLKLKYFGNS